MLNIILHTNDKINIFFFFTSLIIKKIIFIGNFQK